MRIGPFDVKKRVLVIAEIGNNHEGSLDVAKEMIRAASEVGAGAVKFQTITPEKLVSSDQHDRLRQLEKYAFSPAQFQELQQEAARVGLLFLSTPFDLDAVEVLQDLVPAFKIASGDSNFIELLQKIASTGKPVMVSTGLSDETEKKALREFFHSAWRSAGHGNPGLALLHCVAEYPTPDERAGLQYLRALGEMEGITPGYSDHTLGIEAAVLAVGLGARIVEKHFTLDKTRTTFRDHALSADPADFRALITRIRRAESLLAPIRCEDASAINLAARRSAAANKNLEIGHKIKDEDIIWLRPGDGFSPDSKRQVVGRILTRPVAKGRLFVKEDFRS